MDITNIKVRDLLFIILGIIVLTGTTANGLLFWTVWEQYQEQASQIALYKVIGSLVLGVISVFTVITIIVILTKHFRRPLRSLTDLMINLAEGDLDIHVPYKSHKNEFGSMARTLEMFREKLADNKRLTDLQEQENQAKIEQAKLLEEAIAEFDETAQQVMKGMRGSMDSLSRTSQSLGHIAAGGLSCAQQLQTFSSDASENTGSVYNASQDMLTSISHVADNICKSQHISKDATSRANSASTSIAQLQESADKIDDVISLINKIAKETNMLALNATIEAARAGEAGKGFAVVAGEVKKLATETSSATEEISAQVDAVKERVQQTVGHIDGINAVIQQMNDTLELVAQSMQKQTQTSDNIATNAQNAVAVSKSVLKTSDDVYDSAKQTEQSADLLNQTSNEFLGKIEDLCDELNNFFSKIKR